MKSIHVISSAALIALVSIGTALASPVNGHAVLAQVALHRTLAAHNYVTPVAAQQKADHLHPYDGEAAPQS